MKLVRRLRAPRFSLALVLATGAVAALIVAAPSAAACTYSTLTSGVPQAITGTPTYCRFGQGASFWAAVAVRPQGTSDWDLVVYQYLAGEPDCVTNALASSTYGGNAVDFVVGDFNHNGTNEYYPKAYRYSGADNAAVEWDDWTDALTVDAAPISRDLAAEQIIEAWDVYLAAGQTYAFHFDHSASTNFKIFLFQNPGGTYWAGRGSALVTSDGCFSVTASSTDYYGVVVVNEGGVSGTYTLGVSSGQCTCPVELVSGTPSTISTPETHASFDQYANYWTAVGVRSGLGADYDLAVYSKATGGTYPVCFSNLVQQSQYGTTMVDFVVGDFNSNPRGTHFARAYLSAGSGLGQMEWDDGYDQLIVNDAWTFRWTGPGDVLEVWDVLLEAGKTYGFEVRSSAPGVSLSVFRNPTGGVYWTNSSGAVQGTTTVCVYTAPSTGYYGVVVVNVDGSTGMYGVRVLTCEPIQALTSGVAVVQTGGQGFYSFNQANGFWTAVGHRHLTEDFDISVYGNGSGPAWSGCLSDWKGQSTMDEIPDVDYVAGDFNHTPIGTYYAWVSQFSRDATLGGATVEWDSGPDQLHAGDAPLHRITGANDLLECWDVFLQGGKTYSVNLDASAGVDARAELFQNQGGTWMGRTGSVYSGAGHGSFTPPVDDVYGLVVVNRNGGTGTYDIGVFEVGVGVDDSPSPLASGIEAIVPNPARGALRLDYALEARAAARFEALDMAGRIVWRQDEGERDAGRWSVEWRGLDSGGRRLPPGLYFVRMTVGGRTVALRKATLLE